MVPEENSSLQERQSKKFSHKVNSVYSPKKILILN